MLKQLVASNFELPALQHTGLRRLHGRWDACRCIVWTCRPTITGLPAGLQPDWSGLHLSSEPVISFDVE